MLRGSSFACRRKEVSHSTRLSLSYYHHGLQTTHLDQRNPASSHGISNCRCFGDGGECAARATVSATGSSGRQRQTQYVCAGVRTAVELVEILAQKVVRDAAGGAREIRHLARQPSLHRLPQQLRGQARIHTAHEPIRRSGESTCYLAIYPPYGVYA